MPRAVFSMIRARHAFVRDRRAASRAGHRSCLPVSMRSSAAGAPASRGRRFIPPQPGTMPSMTSGRPEPRAGLVDDDAIAARERELQPAAEAKAADRAPPSDTARAASRSKVSQPRLTIASAAASSPIALNSSTSAPAMKPLALPDAMTRPRGGSRSSVVERLVELREHRRAERVGGRAFAVERQPRDAVGIAGKGPVSHRESRFLVVVGAARLPAARVRRRRSHSLHQHRAAQAAADADRGHSAPPAGALQHVEHVEDDSRARTRRPDGRARWRRRRR